MDKNTIIGLLLMLGVIIGFYLWSKPSDEQIAMMQQQRLEDSIAKAQMATEALQIPDFQADQDLSDQDIDELFVASPSTQLDTVAVEVETAAPQVKAEEFFVLENQKLKMIVTSKGGKPYSMQIKDYKAYNLETSEPTDSLYLFADGGLSFGTDIKFAQGKTLNTERLTFERASQPEDTSLILTYRTSGNQSINFIYTLGDDDYFVDFQVQLVGMQNLLAQNSLNAMQMKWVQYIKQLEKSHKQEQNNSGIRYWTPKNEKIHELSSLKADKAEEPSGVKWIAFKNQFFSTILISNDLIQNADLESRPLSEESPYVQSVKASFQIPAKLDLNQNTVSSSARFYFGPLGYMHLKKYDDGVAKSDQNHFDQLVPLGWFIFHVVNEYIIIPIFYLLSSSGMAMGLVIFLLTLIIKIIISPLTYKSFMSSAKMRVLKPQVDEIGAKYPNKEQAAEKQREIMSLYNRAGANPLSGCLPILLQMPFLIALFKFFPNAIELRQKGFLWAHDLSTYDSILTFSFHVPLLGNHLSLFCLLMTLTNIIYTKFNMEMSAGNSDQMPGMKLMMYIMPVAFLFILNDYPSGLTYYYFISLLITILLTLYFRHTVDEEKVLAKLEENKNKPPKPNFMARMAERAEEAKRAQEQMEKQRQKMAQQRKKKPKR